ncbi:MAG: nucleotide pyrophosphohydrolase [Proteobacteria bacterium]|nr:nucleotide pyrophosphohydrolase [Pseudomonadota bacterium]
MTGLKTLALELRKFAKDRDWERFHSPKNTSMALSAEAGELLEHFQWLSESKSYRIDESKKLDVSFEMADILLYLVRLADVLEIDLIDASLKKISLNQKKYPIALSKGSKKKYTEFE